MYIQHKLIKNLHLHRFKHTIYYYNFILFIYTPLHNLIDIAHLNIKLTIINYNFNRRKLDYIKLPHFQKDPKNLILSDDNKLYDFKHKIYLEPDPKYDIMPSIKFKLSVKPLKYDIKMEELIHFIANSLKNKNKSKYFEITLSDHGYRQLYNELLYLIPCHFDSYQIRFNTRLIIQRKYNQKCDIAQIVVKIGKNGIDISKFKNYYQYLYELIFDIEN